MLLIKAINNLFYFYFILIILRIFLTWIPSINWYKEPYKSLSMITDLYLNIFRAIIPPLGGLDFSPIIAIIVLQILQVVVVNVLGGILM